MSTPIAPSRSADEAPSSHPSATGGTRPIGPSTGVDGDLPPSDRDDHPPVGHPNSAPADDPTPATGDDPNPPSESDRGVDPSKPYRLSPRVGLRPEKFGAMAYHFDNRRLVFLKSTRLLELARALEQHPSVDAAITAVVGKSPAARTNHVKALDALLEAEVICER